VLLVRGRPHPALAGVVAEYADFAERTGSPRETGEVPGRGVVVIVDLDAGGTVEGERFGSFAGGLYACAVRVRHEGRRHLAARFERDVGVSPKQAARLIRFEAARRRLGAVPLARLAAEHGYADQAHLAREFRALAGTPPTAFPILQDDAGPPA
jgi:Helix-turn-helix domain